MKGNIGVLSNFISVSFDNDVNLGLFPDELKQAGL